MNVIDTIMISIFFGIVIIELNIVLLKVEQTQSMVRSHVSSNPIQHQCREQKNE